MNLNDYQEKAEQTAIYSDEYAILYPTLGLVGEAGEVANKVKKILRDNEGEMGEEQRESLISELGDVLWYVSALAKDLDISLEEVATRNLDKLQNRKEKGVISGSGDNRGVSNDI